MFQILNGSLMQQNLKKIITMLDFQIGIQQDARVFLKKLNWIILNFEYFFHLDEVLMKIYDAVEMTATRMIVGTTLSCGSALGCVKYVFFWVFAYILNCFILIVNIQLSTARVKTNGIVVNCFFLQKTYFLFILWMFWKSVWIIIL